MAGSPSLGRGSSSLLQVQDGAAAASTRPVGTLKRTASTASVNARVMDMLNPAHREQYMEDMGMQEDWEVEDELEDEDPFGPSTSTRSGGMLPDLDDDHDRESSPPSSPTLGRSALPTPPKSTRRSAKKASSVAMMGPDSDDEEAEDDNPFLARGPPKAANGKGKHSVDRNKVSYVFRGKRITYNAPIDSLFPTEEEEDGVVAANLKSGPRVLFPCPPTPSPSEKLAPLPANVSPPASAPSTTLLMQTPRRKAAPPPEFSTPAERISAALSKRSNGEGGEKKDSYDPASFIPPTPASLPQKSKAEREADRQRLQSQMRAAQSVHRGEGSHRRYAPYPPR